MGGGAVTPPPGSWVLTRRATGELIGEFYDWQNVLRFNPKKVIVETALDYLVRLNAKIRGTP